MTLLEELYAQLAVVNGHAWPEEILIRGAEDGSIKGAHVTFGYAHPGIGNSVIRNVVGPWPLSVLGNDPIWGPVSEQLNANAIDQLGQALATLAQRDDEISGLQSQLETSNGQLEAKNLQVASLTHQVSELEEQVAYLTSQLETASNLLAAAHQGE